MRKKGETVLRAMLVLSAFLANGAENLLVIKDPAKLSAWGMIANQPADTGEVKLEAGVLTLTRKKLSGYLKFYTVAPAIAPGNEYRFLCKLKKAGAGQVKSEILYLKGKKWETLVSNSHAQGGEWLDIEIPFKVAEDMEKILFQFFPPREIDGSLSLSQLTLLPASDKTPKAELLQPVVIPKIRKPVAEPAGSIRARPYREQNLLLNGDFAKKNINVNTPLYWLHGYGLNEPGSNRLDCSLDQGVFSFKAPVSISQIVDISQEAALEYSLVFEAQVASGRLDCAIGANSLAGKKINSGAAKTVLPAGGWQTITLPFAFKPEDQAGILRPVFSASGSNATVKLAKVVLAPTLPENVNRDKNVYIDGKENMYPVRGICVPEEHTCYELKAAKYLQKYLYAAAGKLVNIYPADGREAADRRGLVFVGDQWVTERQRAELKTGGYAISNTNGTLYIGGNAGDDGVIQGVFAVLQSLGLEFFTAADYSRPEDGDPVIREANLVKNPALGYRFPPGGGQTSLDALRYSDGKLAGDPRRLGRWLWSEHTASFLVDAALYFQAHPEYFAMNEKGERPWPGRGLVDIHLCLSNPEVQQIAAATLLQWIEAEPWAQLFYVACGDGAGWCQCAKCKAWDAGGGGSVLDGTFSDRNLRFVNIIAREAAKKHPDKIILTLAYFGCRQAPRQIKPEPNVRVVYCPYPPGWNCWRHAYCEKNLHGLAEFSQWVQQHPGQVFLYDYPNLDGQPHGGFYAMVRKIRLYNAFGIGGIFFNGRGSFNQLFDYVISKTLWDPYTDVEAHIDKFMKFYYGEEAAPVMRAYFNLVHETEQARSLHRYDQGPTMVNDGFFEKGIKLLDQAVELKQNGEARGTDSIREQKMFLLREYLAYNNKAGSLQGERLKQYALNLAELLRLYKTFGITTLGRRLSLRDMLMREAQMDIGDYTPWHASPVIEKFLNDPVAMMTAKARPYRKTAQGLEFNLQMCPGGENMAGYKNNGIPLTTRACSKVLRRASSPYSIMNATFDLDVIPPGDMLLEIEGLDDEKPEHASLTIKVNGKAVFSGLNTFGEDEWSVMTVKIPAASLQPGENSLAIANTTPDRTAAPAYEGQPEAPVQNYKWGWIMISNAVLLNCPGDGEQPKAVKQGGA